MGDEQWTERDDVAAALAAQDQRHAAFVARHFFMALLDYDFDSLDLLVTPESRPEWGNFSAVSQWLAGVQDAGIQSIGNRADGAKDVAYVGILGDSPEIYRFTSDTVVQMAGIVTLVWRPEFGRWMVHGVGDYIGPDDLPRTSPDEAPDA